MSAVAVCKVEDVAPDSVRRFDTAGLTLAIYNIDGTFYATDDKCTHGLASLAEGTLDGDVIECHLHFGAFDVKTGKAVSPPCSVPIKTYPVTVAGSDVMVEI